MTINEAVEVLRKYYGCRTTTGCGSLGNLRDRCEYDVDADTVTEALKTVLDTFGNCSELPNSSGDCISRQAAIDALDTVAYDFTESGLSETELIEVCEAVGDVRQDMISRIKKLPSVQTQQMIPTQMPETSNYSTKFKPGDKFLLEIGEKRVGLDEYSIVGTDLYVWG